MLGKVIGGFIAPFLPQLAIGGGILVLLAGGYIWYLTSQNNDLRAQVGAKDQIIADLSEQLAEQTRLALKREIIIERDKGFALDDAVFIEDLKLRSKLGEDYFATAGIGDRICFTEEDSIQLQTLWN